MRSDLTARLRDIVRQRVRPLGPDEPRRELTYVPEPDPSAPKAESAGVLGGTFVDEAGACVVIDRIYEAERSHGRHRIEACAPSAGWPLELFDRRLRATAEWWRKVVFFDIETTGLSGGAGTLAFLAGCAWFEPAGFRVRQYLLVAPAGEHAMLAALADLMRDASLLVTYNGRTFDVPFMETRWAFHRRSNPLEDLAHFDMLPAARRLWSRRESVDRDDGGCSLSTLERAVLGVHRDGDVPGFEIPARYFHFLRTGDAGAIDGVLEHNRQDLVSLAVILSHASWLAGEGPDACREPSEQLALGQLYERAGDDGRAQSAYARAAQSFDRDVRRRALAAYAELLRRAEQFDEAAAAWQQVLDMAPRGGSSSLDRRAAEALAIHHEHRRKDLDAARHYAETLKQRASGTLHRETERRLKRLDRKRSARLL